MGNSTMSSNFDAISSSLEPLTQRAKTKFGIRHQSQCQPFTAPPVDSMLLKTNLTQFDYNSPLLPSSLEPDKEILPIAQSENFEKLKARYGRPDYFANVISFIGDTRSGKSTIIAELLERLSSTSTVAFKPTTAVRQSFAPTTGDANLYVASTVSEATTSSTSLSTENESEDALKTGELFIIDYEGSNGSSKLPVDVEEDLKKFTENNQRVLDTALRRRSANEHFPRLALLTSDVIVVMTELDLANSRNLDQISEVILQQAFHGVDFYEKPFLVIVKNKSSNEKPLHFDELTKEFKEAHKENVAKLSNYYAGLSVVEIPSWSLTAGKELYQQRIDELYLLLKRLINTRYHLKSQSGSLISQKSWFILLQIVLEDSNRDLTLNFPRLLHEVLKLSSEKILQATYNFYTAYATILREAEQFELLRDITTKYLLLHSIEEYLSSGLDSTVLFSPQRIKEFSDQVVPVLEQFYAYSLTFEPCRSKKGNNSCKEVRCTHSNNHFVNPKNAASWTVLKQNFKNIFSPNIKVETWSGAFEPSSFQTEVVFVDAALGLLKQLLEEIKKSGKNYASRIPVKMYDEIKQLSGVSMEPVIHASNSLCTLCFKHSAEPFPLCKHLLFCNECKTHLYRAEDATQCEVKCTACSHGG